MAWETPKRGRPVYTRSHRIGDRVVREYVGPGLIGKLAELEDKAKRKERADKLEAERAAEAELRELDARAHAIDLLAESALSPMLEAAGYHRPKRGQWRRRRGKKAKP